MKVLITGATGFLGSHLCQKLYADGHKVTAFHRATSQTALLSPLGINEEIGDITDSAAVRRAVVAQDVVIHAAADITYWAGHKVEQEKTNVGGTENVIRACQENGATRLVHISSVAAVGIPEDPHKPANEEFEFNLAGSGLNYHLSKRRAEELVIQASRTGLDAIVINPASILGPYGTRYRGLEIIQKVRNAHIVPYFVGGTCVTHVHDVVEGILNAINQGKTGHRYILGGENITYKAFAARAAAALGLRRSFVPMKPVVTGLAATLFETLSALGKGRPKISYATHYCASRFHFYNSEKARRFLNFTPRDFNAILEECLRYEPS